MVPLLAPPLVSSRVSSGLLVLRAVAGLAFMFHGYGKIQSPFTWMGPDANVPGVFQALAAVAEFCGGLGWILGLLTPIASFGLACTMAVATWTHASLRGDPFVASAPGAGSFEPALVYFCTALLFLLAGPGRYSVDQALFGHRTSERTSGRDVGRGIPAPDMR
jgi:putative oxidoreductase